MIAVNCPSCGAKVAFQSTVSLLAVCAYCRSLLMRRDLDVENMGKIAALQADGSPVQIGARGEFEKISFSVLGRVQMRYPEGYWNEWHLGFSDGRQGWLGEAQGIYAVSFPLPATSLLPVYHELQMGQPVVLGGLRYEVRDKREAEYISLEGEVPFHAPLGVKAPTADLSGPEGRCATLDYSESPPLVFAGRYADFDSLRFQGLKAMEGW